MTIPGDTAWIAEWLDSVQRVAATMSQRAVTRIEQHGGLEAVVDAAKARGVHLVQLTDDQGARAQ